MTMSSMDPSQKQIMYMMPVIFTFIFLKMPAGLVIYWLTNSLLDHRRAVLPHAAKPRPSRLSNERVDRRSQDRRRGSGPGA
jgi:hypothetical protein